MMYGNEFSEIPLLHRVTALNDSQLRMLVGYLIDALKEHGDPSLLTRALDCVEKYKLQTATWKGGPAQSHP
jgi:hypothetical protein